MNRSQKLGEAIRYRLATDNARDVLAFCDLYNSLYLKRVGPDYVSWQFFQTPFPSFLCVAADGTNCPIGFYGLHLLTINVDDLITAWVLDVMIRPDYQDKGLFRPLAAFAREQLSKYRPAGMFVMANPNGANAHIHGLGWKKINTYVSYVAPTEFPDQHLPPGGVEFQRVSCRPDSLGRGNLVGDSERLKVCRVRRDQSYTRWRYAENPRFSYDQFVMSAGGKEFGYLALKSFRDPLTSEVYGDIVDLDWTDNDSGLLAEMLRFALRFFRGEGVRQALMWLHTNTVLDEVGARVGFRTVAQKRFFCGLSLDTEHSWLERPDSWYVSLSDSEIY